MKNLFFILSVLFSVLAFGQDCNCEESFAWMKKTFEENDAGYQVTIDKKGKSEYEKYNQFYLDKVKKITDINECGRTLYDWLKFFRSGHISVNVDVLADNKNWETVSMTEAEVESYLANVPLTSFEGIWKTEPYKIAIIKKNEEYIGFVLDAPGTPWQKNHVKLKFSTNKDKTGFSGKYYLRNYSDYDLKKVEMIGNNYMKLGQFSLQRVNPKAEDIKSIKTYLELMRSQKPVMLEYSKNTLVLRIPSFHQDNKKIVDSLLSVYHKKITSTQNFVIDIRNNGGGADRTFTKIIPYLYTNPIRTIGVEMLSTPLNNQRMESFLTMPDFTEEDKKEIAENLKTLNENLGKFVNLHGEKVFTDTHDKVYQYPKNVAVLINENNGSTAEQFLLAVKQSSKTKLFGKTTMGALDVSNMHFVKAPCWKIELGYCLSKSYRIPHMAIDEKGIQPDYYMDDTIPDYEWIEFAETTFQKKK